MVNYIKDTDFLPEVKDVSNDVYKLIYGVPKLFVETQIYDAITRLCRAYNDTPLRKAKINAWKSAINGVIERLERKQEDTKNAPVYIPYFERLCSADSLINLYNFAAGVLVEMEKLPRIPNYRQHMDRDKVQCFFPFGSFVEVMREFGAKCAKSCLYGNEVEIAIEKELENRGLIESSTLQATKTFEEIFYGKENQLKISVQEDEGEKEDRDLNLNKITNAGFLYKSLYHYFEEVFYDKKIRILKENEVEKELQSRAVGAAMRIACGLFDSEKPIAGVDRAKIIYYVYADKFKKGKCGKETQEQVETLYKRFISDTKKK